MHVRNISRSALAAMLVAASFGTPVAATGPEPAPGASSAPIIRFVQLDHDLYRGGQPDGAGFQFLRDLGIRTVISFRNDASERAAVEALGMRFVSIPVTFRAFGWGDDFDAADVRAFFAALDDPEAGSVFFHCKRGADRTGSFAAVYRIARQGWEVDQALAEASDMGMRWWYFPMRAKIAAFARQTMPAVAGTE
jgi:protein tyrosine phosphatase (PTP) superfamily phosphohydrolase (DUF442 family)